MSQLRTIPTLGVAASLCVLAVLAVPYVLVEGGSGVATYYSAGAINPLVVGIFALVAVIVFAAGREGRTPPDLAAGAALVLGLFMTVLSVLWAATVPESVVFQLTTATVLEYHRWALVLVSLSIPGLSLWYARAQQIL